MPNGRLASEPPRSALEPVEKSAPPIASSAGVHDTQNQERWEKIQEIFEAACTLGADQQTAFVTEACGDDAALSAEVLSLLQWRDGTGDFLEAAVFRLSGESPDESLHTHATIGRYRLLRELDSGGMGTVYVAERADGEFDQVVAIKVIRSKLPSARLLRHFHAERQILAKLHHPNIAQLLDGGTTSEGQPYLVMEYIDGCDICRYADERLLTIKQRLRLFLQVCSAVQRAHQSLIVHCDLKPSNVLVTAEGFPKLLDFGIASVVTQRLNESAHSVTAEQDASLTAAMTSAQFALTPAYASPEQLAGGPITTATDVYSLGALLFVLLSGLSPFEEGSRKQESADMSLATPAAPSAQLLRGKQSDASSALARSRGTTSRGLIHSLQGDVDEIVLKAMKGDPQQRYNSVEQMAADISAHLELRPIAARAGSASYRYRRFFSRNRFAVLAAAGVALAMVAGTAGVVWQAHIAQRERGRAVRRFNDVRQVAYSVLFELSDAIQQLPGSTAAQALLANRATSFLSSMAQDAGDDTAFHWELAAAYRRLGTLQGLPFSPNIGDAKAAVRSFRSAVYWGERARARDPGNANGQRELAAAYDDLGVTLEQGDKEAIPDLEQAIAIDRALMKRYPQRADIANSVALSLQHASTFFRRRGDLDTAMAMLKESAAIATTVVAAHPQNSAYLGTLSFTDKKMGGILINREQWDEALKAYMSSLDLDRRQNPAGASDARKEYDATFAYDDIGYIYWHRGDPDEGLRWYRKSLAIREAAVAADPTNRRSIAGVATVEAYMGGIYTAKKDWSNAIAAEQRVYALREQAVAQPHSGVGQRLDLFNAEYDLAGTFGRWARERQRKDQQALEGAAEWRKQSQALGSRLLASGELGPADSAELRKQLRKLEDGSALTEKR